MKIKVSKNKRRSILKAIEELREEIKDNFGYRIHSFFYDPEDIPLIHFTEYHMNEIYKMREKATEKFKGLKKPIKRFVDSIKDELDSDTNHVIINVSGEDAEEIVKALKSLKKLYEKFSDTVQISIDSSVEEEGTIDAKIEEIRRLCRYVKIEVINPYVTGYGYGDTYKEETVKQEIARFKLIIDDLDFAIKKFSKD
jgi:DNA-binding protein